MPLSAEEIATLQAKARDLRCDMIDVTVWAGDPVSYTHLTLPTIYSV